MIRLVTRGRFTQDYAKGLLAAPEDREPAVRKSKGPEANSPISILRPATQTSSLSRKLRTLNLR